MNTTHDFIALTLTDGRTTDVRASAITSVTEANPIPPALPSDDPSHPAFDPSRPPVVSGKSRLIIVGERRSVYVMEEPDDVLNRIAVTQVQAG